MPDPSPAENRIIRLTGREIALGMMLARRLRHKEIAARFGATPGAISHRVNNLFRLLNVHSLNEFIEIWNERPGVEKGVVRGDLPTRQIQIGTLLLEGMKREEIAEELKIRPKTVSTHIHYMFNKFGLSGPGSEEKLLENLRDLWSEEEAGGESAEKTAKESAHPHMSVALA